MTIKKKLLIFEAICNEDYKEIFYFVKLASNAEKSVIQQILQMELAFEGQSENRGVTLDEKLYLKNPEFVLGIDLSFQAYALFNRDKRK